MSRYANTNLWHRTLAQRTGDPEESNRTRLRTSFERFRERAATLAAEIGRDLPDFTVHDITHIDALWEMADLIAGDDYPITPAEAYVLGGAFLIHDLGLGLAAYPAGIEELKSSDLWLDTVAGMLRREHGRPATEEQIKDPPAEIAQRATEHVLRMRHAEQAERLALVSWPDPAGGTLHLIEDANLRSSYGSLIGRIAHSHWWPIDQIARGFPSRIGAPGGFNRRWTIDPVKLACMLRTADASHLDKRRADPFLHALRRPEGYSADHWTFQAKLNQPRLERDRLEYTSSSDFEEAQAEAWWLCADTLRMVDQELRRTDTLLADTDRPRLAARSVAYTDAPESLAQLVRTNGWLPVDARVQVSDVVSLISALGGEKLYGDSPTVPLRELIQNAADAVRARRLLESRENDWGHIVVHTGQDDDGHWLEVKDTGIGMSVDVLTGPFLDFSTSFWGSSLMHAELPGLERKGFEATGQFGIGFFSVFMWGDHVRVVTRRPDRASSETLTLEFTGGLGTRPILKTGNVTPELLDAGTVVRVWFRDGLSPANSGLLVARARHSTFTLAQCCAWLCPTLDVDLYADEGELTLAVKANDWLSIEGQTLLDRIDSGGSIQKERDRDGARLRILDDNLGRACIAIPTFFDEDEDGNASSRSADRGLLTTGGFRASDSLQFQGVLKSVPSVAARNQAALMGDMTIYATWATEQARLAEALRLPIRTQIEVAEKISAFGGDIGDLAFALTRSGAICKSNISDFLQHEEIVFVHPFFVSNQAPVFIPIPDNVLIIEHQWKATQSSNDDVESFGNSPDGMNTKQLPKTNKNLLFDFFLEEAARVLSVHIEDLSHQIDWRVRPMDEVSASTRHKWYAFGVLDLNRILNSEN